jgi:quinol monooxygenase YgiN
MRVVHGGLIAAAILTMFAVPGALAQAPAGPADLVTYLEVTPSAEMQTAGLLRQLAAASRKEAGNVRYDVLQNTDRRSQFAILETWRDGKAFEAHAAGAGMKQFRAALDPLRVGYYDERLDTAIDIGPAPQSVGKDAIFVATHVDVTGQFKDGAIMMMKKLAADSRKEPGSERFEIWQQNNRLNHFTMVEVWKDQSALDAHGRGAPSREFREQVGQMMGALYDDRRYRALE